MPWDGVGKSWGALGSKVGGAFPVPEEWGHFSPGGPELALGPCPPMPGGRRWGAGSQESSGRCERPGEIDLLGTMKQAKSVCRLSDDSGVPQGSTKCEHQRIKDRPPPTLAASPEPLLLLPPPPPPSALRAWSPPGAAETQPFYPAGPAPPSTLPDLPRMTEEVRHI